MKADFRYLRYVLRHKWFVLLAGLKLGVPLWQLLIHDLSKFSAAEWEPYVEYFYGGPHEPLVAINREAWSRYGIKSKEEVAEAFDRAWLHHIHANPHHWQHYILHEDNGAIKILPMPRNYLLEMVADWQGAGQALGKPDTQGWYLTNRTHITLDSETRRSVEFFLHISCVG